MKKLPFSLVVSTLKILFIFILITAPIQVKGADINEKSFEDTGQESSIWNQISEYFENIVTFDSSEKPQFRITSAFDCAPAPFVENTVRARTSGNWNDPGTWGGVMPRDGDMVVIPKGISVTVRRQENARLPYIEVNGALIMNHRIKSRLFVETLKVQSGGSFIIGSARRPVKADSSAEIVFLNNGVIANPTLSNRGLIVEGTCTIYGLPKTPFVEAKGVKQGATSIQVNSMGNHWRVGDQIVIPATSYNPGELRLNLAGKERAERDKPSREQIKNAFRDEKVTITSIDGNSISFSPSLKFNHSLPNGSVPFHVANVSRNITFRSESSETSRRGHTMFMAGSNVYIQGARFYQLGRTDKRVPLDDFQHIPKGGRKIGNQVRRKTNPASIKNNRGRYAVHFHRNGVNENDVTKALATVTNSVVEDVPGWGFVNHSSHVDFINNVAFNFTGAGFVTEIGDELGTFDGNIAIQGHGNGELRERRLGFKTNTRLPVINDFGFGGDGFWFQGPAVRVTNNVSVSCNGSGMIWFTTGGVQDAYIGTEYTHSTFVGMRESVLRKVYPEFTSGRVKPRKIIKGHENETEPIYLLVDLPILECANNTAYTSHIGFNLRFNNTAANKFYEQGPYLKGGYFDNSGVKRTYQTVDNLVLWNNFIAINASYTGNTNFNNAQLFNAQRRRYLDDYNVVDFAIQGEHANNLKFNDISLNGYGLGGVFQRKGSVINEGSIVVNTALDLHRLHNRGDKSCKTVEVRNTRWNNENSLRINFDNEEKQRKVAIRYKELNQVFWNYKSFTTSYSYIDIDAVNRRKSYEFQVLRGCNNKVAKQWSETGKSGSNSNKALGEQATSIALYPNPASSQINVNVSAVGKETLKSMSIYDINGKKISELSASQDSITSTDLAIDVSNYPQGLYIVKMLMESGSQFSQKMVIKR